MILTFIPIIRSNV